MSKPGKRVIVHCQTIAERRADENPENVRGGIYRSMTEILQMLIFFQVYFDGVGYSRQTICLGAPIMPKSGRRLTQKQMIRADFLSLHFGRLSTSDRLRRCPEFIEGTPPRQSAFSASSASCFPGQFPMRRVAKLYVGLSVRRACNVAGRTNSPTYEWLFPGQFLMRRVAKLYVGLTVRRACNVAGRTNSPTYGWLFSGQFLMRRVAKLYVGLSVRQACNVAGRTNSPTYEWLFPG